MSKELEALETINEGLHCSIYERDNHMYDEELDILKSSLERKDQLETENAELKARNEKLEKFVEIVKSCSVNVSMFNTMFVQSNFDYNYYLKNQTRYSLITLTEEEFNLLKEMLK